MSTAPLTVKLRCASWRQLRTIYERDLKREAFFLKSKKPPPLGTAIRIQLTLPSESMVILRGAIEAHIPEGGLNGRGPGIDIKLTSIPQSALWLIETALKAENTGGNPAAATKTPPAATAEKPPAATAEKSQAPPPKPDPVESSIDDGENQVDAEHQLLEALADEYESLQKLNPFQILGLGYEVGDDAVRTAFGDLTKKYHPDRFRRFENNHIREYASEIFILIRDAYQQLGKQADRDKVRRGLKTGSVTRSFKPPTLPPVSERQKIEQAATMLPDWPPPAADKPAADKKPADKKPAAKKPAAKKPTAKKPAAKPPPIPGKDPSTKRDPMVKQRAALTAATDPASEARILDDKLLESEPTTGGSESKRPDAGPPDRFAECKRKLDAGDYLEARDLYSAMLRNNPGDTDAKAGLELCEGLKALAEGDRMEAAQRFELVLELDASNERAARELANMRRHATNQRKGLLTKLLGQRGKE